MFNESTRAQLKTLVDELNTTQASLINALVEFALTNAPTDQLDVVARKKRGRKPKANGEDTSADALTAEVVEPSAEQATA